MTQERADDLLPCPFCGKIPHHLLSEVQADDTDYVVHGVISDDCPVSGVLIPFGAWNTRSKGTQDGDQKHEEALAVFSDSMNTIRWLLNHAEQAPKKHIGGLMECFTVKDNHTTKCSEQLECLWELRQTISAALEQSSIPPGYALVPIEQTAEMLEAGYDAIDDMIDIEYDDHLGDIKFMPQ